MAKNKKGDNKSPKQAEKVDKTKSESKKTSAGSSQAGDGMSRNIVVAALIIILLLAGIGFLVFGLVQSISDSDNDGDKVESSEDKGDDGKSDERANSDASDNDSDDNDKDSDGGDDAKPEGSLNGEGLSDSEVDGDGDKDGDVEATEKYPTTNTVYRRGNDYEFGDIKGDKYVIKKGDTLWQIAEGRYGSGYAWVDINDANGHFPLLKDGTPVLLQVGQEITLPNL